MNCGSPASPDVPVADILLFVGLVPLVAAAALQRKKCTMPGRSFGLLDLSILSSTRSTFLPSSFTPTGCCRVTWDYNHNFNIADAIGNQLFAIATGVAFLRERVPGVRCTASSLSARNLRWASNLSMCDRPRRVLYGSLYDVPLIAAMGGYICLCLAGRPLLEPTIAAGKREGEEQKIYTGRSHFFPRIWP